MGLFFYFPYECEAWKTKELTFIVPIFVLEGNPTIRDIEADFNEYGS
jgi:hypothetical protein